MVPVPTIAMRCTGFCVLMIVAPYCSGWWWLAPAPDRGSFFGERQCSFMGVLAVEQARSVLGLALERLGVVETLGFSQDRLYPGQGQWCVAGDAPGKRLCPGQCRPGSGQLADEPVLLGIDGRERLAGEQHLEGDVVGD